MNYGYIGYENDSLKGDLLGKVHLLSRLFVFEFAQAKDLELGLQRAKLSYKDA